MSQTRPSLDLEEVDEQLRRVVDQRVCGRHAQHVRITKRHRSRATQHLRHVEREWLIPRIDVPVQVDTDGGWPAAVPRQRDLVVGVGRRHF